MKNRLTRCGSILMAGAFALGIMSFPEISSARDRGDLGDRYDRHDRGRDDDRYHYRGKKRKYSKSHFRKAPRASFSIVFGNGYRGPGYYYGPRDADYFYEAPGVTYYRTIDVLPGRVAVAPRGSLEVAAQRSLARLGYYRGPIDGDFGAGSRRALASFQRDQGLRPTGSLTVPTQRALGLRR